MVDDHPDMRLLEQRLSAEQLAHDALGQFYAINMTFDAADAVDIIEAWRHWNESDCEGAFETLIDGLERFVDELGLAVYGDEYEPLEIGEDPDDDELDDDEDIGPYC